MQNPNSDSKPESESPFMKLRIPPSTDPVTPSLSAGIPVKSLPPVKAHPLKTPDPPIPHPTDPAGPPLPQTMYSPRSVILCSLSLARHRHTPPPSRSPFTRMHTPPSSKSPSVAPQTRNSASPSRRRWRRPSRGSVALQAALQASLEGNIDGWWIFARKNYNRSLSNGSLPDDTLSSDTPKNPGVS
ncbi:hypothetical protein B0H14DRAFT_3455397 [Mycena olivaceomarginata]|nr:hypothetical protein B0H14DRAFT_3455397 [Mycena olivaceomarginata]